MRRLPRLGPIESFFASEKAAVPDFGDESSPTTESTKAAADAPSDDQTNPPPGDARSTAAPARSPEDTISLDGVSLDEILAQTDAADEVAPAPDESGNDTGEWEAIEDMLAPDVMLREKTGKKTNG